MCLKPSCALLLIIHISTAQFNIIISEVNKFGKNLADSFNLFKNIIIKFFYSSVPKIEQRRQHIKKAFYTFIDQSLKKDIQKEHIAENSSIKFSMNTNITENCSVSKLIEFHGHKFETHTVITSDGYILTLHRILSKNDTITKYRKVVLLHHGLLGSSADWLQPERALPYLLIENGYDVWLANARGNNYSRAHVTENIDSSAFWNYSWHEIGVYDMSATIDYIRRITGGKAEINVIAYSMGATSLLVLLSASTHYNNILKTAVLLAPLVFMTHTKGLIKCLAELINDSWKLTEQIEFKSSEIPCTGVEKLILFTDDFPCRAQPSGSTKTILHYLQLVKSGNFQMYDFGRQLNVQKYGVPIPLSYSLEDITLPITIINSLEDWISTVPDVRTLITKLSGTIIHKTIRRPGFSHTDFLYAEDAAELVYDPVLEALRQKYKKSVFV